MGLFNKKGDIAGNDEDIRREIRARVAKQAGIYDEEYINTGVLGGKAAAEPAPTAEPVPAQEPPAPVSASEPTAEPVQEPPVSAPEPEIAFQDKEKPAPAVTAEPVQEPAAPAPAVAAEPAKAPSRKSKPEKPVPATVAPAPAKPTKTKPPKPPRRGVKNGVLVASLILVLLAIIPPSYALVSLSGCDYCTAEVPCVEHCPDCTAETPCPLHCDDCLDGGYCTIHNPGPVEPEPVDPEPVEPEPPARQVDGGYPVPSLELYKGGGGSVDLQWTMERNIAGYEIQRKTGEDGEWATVKDISKDFVSWTDTGLAKGSTYYYQICSYKVVDGEKVYSPFSSTKKVSI